MEKKRVWALYRVSTKNQVDENNDIPMQRNACREFIMQHAGWQLEMEVYEKGVSGWKKKSTERDELMYIMKGAIEKKFDILLVFMQDRIGRRDDDTPFVVADLDSYGVQVWSVNEGLIEANNPHARLKNYISSYVATLESLKTSQRVTEALKQANEEGRYVGGYPYGYEEYETDRLSKKGRKLKDIRVNQEEAEVVKEIFWLVAEKGWGVNRIAQYLNEMGIKTKKEISIWKSNTIVRMLRNSIYIGRKPYGTYITENGKRKKLHWSEWKLQKKRDELVIVDDETFYKVQDIVDARRKTRDEQRKMGRKGVSVPTKSQLLLSGLCYCGYCGTKLVAVYNQKKYITMAGEEKKYKTKHYHCHHGRVDRSNHEAVTFGSIKYEKAVEETVLNLLDENFNKEKIIQKIDEYKDKNIVAKEKESKSVKKLLEENYKELEALQKEVVNSLMGKGKFNSDLLSQLIEDKEKEIKEKSQKLMELDRDIQQNKENSLDMDKIKELVMNFREKYETADFEQRKMLLASVIDKVVITKGNVEIIIKFGINADDGVSSKKLEVEESVGEISHQDSNVPSSCSCYGRIRFACIACRQT